MEDIGANSKLQRLTILRDAKVEEGKRMRALLQQRRDELGAVCEKLEAVSFDADPDEVAGVLTREAALTHLYKKIEAEGWRLVKEKEAAVKQVAVLEAEVQRVHRSIVEIEASIAGVEGELRVLEEQSDGTDICQHAITRKRAQLSELQGRLEGVQGQLAELIG